MQIFISYSHSDRVYAEKLHNELKKQGFDSWFDDLIEAGEEFESAIKKKLEETEAVISILTPRSVSSPTIQAETSLAKELNKKIYPLLLEDIDENPLSQLRYVDVRDGNLPPQSFYRQIVSANINIIDRLAGDTTTDAPPPDVKKKKKK